MKSARSLENSLFFPLLQGILEPETSSHMTATTTTQSRATGDFLKVYERPRIGGDRCDRSFSETARYSRQVVSAHFSLAPKSRFPETETARGRDSVRMPVTSKEVRASASAAVMDIRGNAHGKPHLICRGRRDPALGKIPAHCVGQSTSVPSRCRTHESDISHAR